MPYYINQPQQYKSVVDPYIEGRRARQVEDAETQNALLRRQQIGAAKTSDEYNRMKMEDYKENRGATNALTKAHTSLYETQAIENRQKAMETGLKTLVGPAKEFDRMYTEALKKTDDDEQAAAAMVQPHYQKFLSTLDHDRYKQAGITMPESFDPNQVRLFIQRTKNLGGKKISVIDSTKGMFTVNEEGELEPLMYDEEQLKKPVKGSVKGPSETDKKIKDYMAEYEKTYPGVSLAKIREASSLVGKPMDAVMGKPYTMDAAMKEVMKGKAGAKPGATAPKRSLNDFYNKGK
jgi:hypothetical protein